MALGIFLWLLAFWFLGSRTLITYTELFRWFALFAFIGNLLPFRKSGQALGMERGEWFFFNLLTVGPVLFTLGLGVNMFFHGKEEVFVVPQANRMNVHRYWIENDGFPPMSSYTLKHGLVPNDMLVGIAPGALGYKVITFSLHIK